MKSYVGLPGGLEWLIIMGMGSVLFLLPIALLVFLFIKLSPKGRWILGSILLAPVLLAALLLAFRFGMQPYASPVGVNTYPAPDARPQVSISQTWSGQEGQLSSQSIQYHSGGGGTVAQTAVRTETAVSWVGLVMAMLLLGPLAILLILLFIKSGRKGRILIGCFVGVMLGRLAVDVVSSLLVHFRPQSTTVAKILPLPQHQPNVPRTPEQQQRTVSTVQQYNMAEDPYYRGGSQTPASTPSISPLVEPGVEHRDLAAAGFEPDVYASKESAVRAVARLLAEQYKRHSPSQDPPPQTVLVSGSFGQPEELGPGLGGYSVGADTLKQYAAYEVSKALAGSSSSLAPMFPDKPMSRPEDVASISESAVGLNIEVLQESGSPAELDRAGLIRATLSGRHGQFTRQIEFVNKAWSEDFERWRSRHGGVGHCWVLGESERLCASQTEAKSQAVQMAARAVTGTIMRRFLDSKALQNPDLGRQRDALNQWLRDIVHRSLEADQFRSDIFTQGYARPYGTLYRCAVLVYVPAEKADALVDGFFRQDRAIRASWLHTLLSGAGLLALIVAVYLFLNMATRGYYVWSVRLATVVLAGVGAWCIVMFVS